MKVNVWGDHSDDVVRRVQSEISSWAPGRGPDWADLVRRADARPLEKLRVYAISSFALAAIILVAFLAMSALDISGSLAGGPIVTRVQIEN